MYLSGLNAIIAMFLTKNVPYRNFLYPAMISGILIPDLESLLVFIADFFLNISLVKNTTTHSLFSILIIYLSILIISELLKLKNGSNIAKGIILGIILHIFTDIIFWGQKIHLLWPLPIGTVEIINLPTINESIIKEISPFEFLFFRLYAWVLLNQTITNNIKFNKFSVYIQLWMKIELALFVLFIIAIQSLEINLYNLFFEIAYIFSLITAILFTCFMHKSLNLDLRN